MTIKDVEKITGMTAKSIRYYESKGLISVARRENDYRNYTEEDVETLRQIRLLRYLEFTVEEIRGMLHMEEEDVAQALKERAAKFVELREQNEKKQEIALALAKDYRKGKVDISEYNEVIDFLESEDGEELRRALSDVFCSSLSGVIAETIMLSGPILWLFLNVYRKMYSILLFNAVAAIICTSLITSTWIYYLQYRKDHKSQAKEKDKKDSLAFPIMLVCIVAAIVLIASVFVAIDELIAPADYLFGEMAHWASTFLMLLIIGMVILLAGMIMRKLNIKRAESIQEWLELWDCFGKWKVIVVLAICVIVYCCLTSSTYVTESKIICHTPLHPAGITYAYEDVAHVKTGFGHKYFAILEYKKKGGFYYIVTMEDGRKVTFSQPNVNEDIERYMDDSYLELEEFDRRLMEYGIEKESDERDWEACDMDQQYVDRFLRIIRNEGSAQ